MKPAILALAMTLATAVPFNVAAADGMKDRNVYKAEMSFDDVRQGIADAIINRGYNIDYTGHIGDMLTRTAADVGATRALYAHAETVQFCSAVLSRKMMEVDIANIVFCPYVIYYFEPADQLGTVYAGHRIMGPGATPESQAALDTINTLLDDIVKEATTQ